MLDYYWVSILILAGVLVTEIIIQKRKGKMIVKKLREDEENVVVVVKEDRTFDGRELTFDKEMFYSLFEEDHPTLRNVVHKDFYFCTSKEFANRLTWWFFNLHEVNFLFIQVYEASLTNLSPVQLDMLNSYWENCCKVVPCDYFQFLQDRKLFNSIVGITHDSND